MISFTNRTVFLLLLAAAGHILSIWFFPAWIMAVVVSLLAALVALDYFSANPAYEVRREMPSVFEVGKKAKIKISVKHNHRRKIKLDIEDCAPDVAEPYSFRFSGEARAGEEISVESDIAAMRRGDFFFGETFIRNSGPLGLVNRKTILRVPDTMTVSVNLDDFRKSQIYIRSSFFLMPGAKTARLAAEGSMFESLREYLPDDDFGKIDWKATARRNQPISRNYETERNQNIILMMDTGRLMNATVDNLTKLDIAARSALALGLVCSAGGDNVGMLSFDRSVSSFIPPGKGRRHFAAIVKAMRGLAASDADPDYANAFNHLLKRKMRRSLVIVFTDLVDPDSASVLVERLAAMRNRHARICVAIKDNEVEDLAASQPSDESGFFRKTIAMSLLEKKKLAYARLADKGVGVIETRPENLSVAAIQRYLELKRGGLL